MKVPQLVNIGEVKFSYFEDLLECKGLGSCIGLFLYDKELKIGGAAHIMLPEVKNEQDKDNTSFALPAFKNLFAKLSQFGSIVSNIEAKIVGGASVLKSDPFKIGTRNKKTIVQILKENNINLVADFTGNNYGRSVIFNTHTGTLNIKNIYENLYK